jgi:hypothetical protein
MIKYVKTYINKQTGNIDAVQVSDLPTHDHIEIKTPDTIPVAIPGQPITPFGIEVEELMIEENGNLRARDYLEGLENHNNKVEIKPSETRFRIEARQSRRDM